MTGSGGRAYLFSHRRVYERYGNRCKPPVLHPSTPRKTPPPGLVPIRQSREVNRQTVIVIVKGSREVEGHTWPPESHRRVYERYGNRSTMLNDIAPLVDVLGKRHLASGSTPISPVAKCSILEKRGFSTNRLTTSRSLTAPECALPAELNDERQS
ncbi:hypothetical protein CC1G_04791 [Coprinopsis cinerea okayama7|uniref:Uncharacterized protein n=1 Tax=Coprinopsis cinerea (strain Okayama-7 / 130 / ATCC MYA-4618 / FGSC 9003) TaxID=240176 RepID=A8P2K8_COPC7|nr:hypothetical protein CC1G_04791 [Coprinopsis cinerea okayama7\|eukprot:XP_001838347.2 hypothetical protein CC1G_04791 [Coprinopsis cinerea okayama7\